MQSLIPLSNTSLLFTTPTQLPRRFHTRILSASRVGFFNHPLFGQTHKANCVKHNGFVFNSCGRWDACSRCHCTICTLTTDVRRMAGQEGGGGLSRYHDNTSEQVRSESLSRCCLSQSSENYSYSVCGFRATEKQPARD